MDESLNHRELLKPYNPFILVPNSSRYTSTLDLLEGKRKITKTDIIIT